jgi:SAM-dependent methyltransferase
MKIDEYQKMYELEETHWWFVGKRKIILSLLDKLYTPTTNLKIMDAGCGTGAVMNYLERYGSVVGVDTSDEALNFCRLRGKGRVYKANITQLPFNDGSYDLVTALDIIEHVAEDGQALRELFRVCKKGGRVTITVPAYNFLWSKHDIALEHRRRYRAKELKKKIENVGFKIEFISHTNIFIFPFALIWRIFGNLLRSRAIPKSDPLPTPLVINKILIGLYSIESMLLKHFSFPYGVSLVCIAKKY